MQTDWIYGLLGGGLIGSAAALFLLVNGKIMGASGIMGGLIDGSGRSNSAERISLLAGLFAAPLLLSVMMGGAQTHLTSQVWVIILGGLLVGVGTRVANGCTSGHGVCGISRLSLRGIVATVFYILAGGLTVALLRHALGII